MVVFEAGGNRTEKAEGASLIKKAEEERKRLQNIFIFVELTAGSQNVRERERGGHSVCVCVSGSCNVRE